MSALRQWLFLSLCLLAGLLSAHNSFGQTPAKLTLDFAQLSVLLDGSDSVPTDLGMRKLPWKWDDEFPRKSGTAYFKINFALDNAQWNQLQKGESGLGLSAINMGSRYRYRMNGGAWQTVAWETENTQYRPRPRWHLLPNSHVMAGVNNLLELEIKTEAASESGLSALEIADVSSSLTAYQHESNLRYFSALLVCVTSFLIAMFALSMWWISREYFFLLTGIAELAFALRQFGIFVDYPFVPTWIWNASQACLFALYVGMVCRASLLMVNKPAPILNKTINAYQWTFIPFLVIGYALHDHRAYRAWLVVMLLLTTICVVRITWHALRNSDINLRLFAVASWVALALGLYDFLTVAVSTDGLGKIRWGVYSSFLFNIGLAIIIVRRFITTRRELLRSRLVAKAEQEQAKMKERQRIMSDIHDSVGSQLVGVLSLIKGGASHQELEVQTADALQELRMAIDAIQPVNGNLAAVLATLRHRLQPRLEAQGIHLIWQVDDLPRLENLTPQVIQHIQKILLEAFSNILTHAQAKTITLKAYSLGKTQCIEVTDDGIGFDSASQNGAAGQGLRNMQFRCQTIGAAFEIHSKNPSLGTTIRIKLTT
jgi:signal transduction histidine kinase